MKERIRSACRDINGEVLIRTVQSFSNRIEKCIKVEGHHFEHLIKTTEMTKMIKLEMPTLKEVLEDCGGNEKLLEEQTHKIRLWLKQQLHLPRDISDHRLRYFICISKFNLERVKRRVDLYYTLRNIIPELTFDPLSKDMIRCYKYIQMTYLPELTPQNYRVSIARFSNSDPSVFDPNTTCKYAILMYEIAVEEDIVVSDIIIIDMAGLRVGHIAKLTPSLFKKLNMYLEAHSRRIKAIHFINAPDAINWLMSIIKALMKVKIFNRIHVHTSGIESLYGMIPKSLLPADYGGNQPPLDILAGMNCEKLIARRRWFLKQNKVRVDESLRSNSVINPDDLFGVAGTFQKLDID